MCGIAAIIDLNPSDVAAAARGGFAAPSDASRPEAPATADTTPNTAAPIAPIARMADRLAHRGPDATNSVRLAGCDLGHTRLSIIDPAGGRQPMSDEHGRVWVAFNGEIFNFRELRADLEGRGWRFRTHSDTEVLLRAYQQWGEDCVRRLNGQFAFVVWDAPARRAFAARDRMGEKPLYWARGEGAHAGRVLLASEIKAILAADALRPRIDRAAVDAYLALYYVPPDRTIYENVHVVPPGGAIAWDAGGGGSVRRWRYWQPAYSTQSHADPGEAVRRIRELVEQAVRRQMVADVPVGAFLSGGLDSSTIVALMSRHATGPVKTFSVGFGDLINELPYARQVAEAYRTEHHELQMDIAVGEAAARMAQVYDEPFADSSNIPTYLMSQFAARHVKVALAGDGGDELFGGYDWYMPLLGGPAGSSAITGPFTDLWDRHLAHATALYKTQAARDALWGGAAPPTAEALCRAYRPADSVRDMDRATDFDLRCYLPGDILVKVDRAAMAHGLETRAPFLDADLVEYVLSLPWQMRFKGDGAGGLKPLLREACGDLWPAALRGRPKQGFGAPVRHWVTRPDVRDLLRRARGPAGPLAALLPGAPAAVEAVAAGKPVARWGEAQLVWTLLCLGLWLGTRSRCL